MRRQGRQARALLIFILILGICLFAGKSLISAGGWSVFRNSPADQPQSSPFKTCTNPAEALSAQDLVSSHAILVRLTDNVILMDKASDMKIYPASMTKIMTAILAIENLPDLNENVRLSQSAFSEPGGEDASMAGFEPGEKVRAVDLLYGALLPSGAECCIGLAEKVSGSEAAFVKLMNDKAEDIGMRNTHFSNVTGLHDDDHYTTAYDMAVLTAYALKNSTFRKIFTSSVHSTPPTNRHPDGITFHSTLFARLPDSRVAGGEILGGKTGYTREAGLCLASLAEVQGCEYILVTAEADGDCDREPNNILDAKRVYGSLGKQRGH